MRVIDVLQDSEAWVRSSQNAIQVHGAWGYLKDGEMERDLRIAAAGTIYSGRSEIQRVVPDARALRPMPAGISAGEPGREA